MAKGVIGAKIVLEGEAQYKKALKDISAAQKELKSEMKLCATEFKNSQNSLDALQKKHQILSKQVEASADKVKVYEKALQSSQDKEKKAADAVDKAKKEYEDAAKAMQEMADSGKATNDELEEQQRVVSKLQDKLSVAEKNYTKASEQTQKYQTSLNYANAELVDMTNELDKNDKYMQEAEKSTDGVARSIDEYGNETKDAAEQTSIFGDVLKSSLTSAAILSAVKALASAMKEVASACIETGMEFEASMSKVQALSGAAGADLESLTEKAKDMGASTMYSASEAADAMSYMALAGWDTKQMLDGIEPVLNLAAAANMDLAQTSDIVTDYLTAFGLEAKDASRFTDQLAYAMAHSNTDVAQLGEAYKNCAAAAASMNFSVEDVTGALMTMANAGVKGGEAGTTLRAIMVRLATDTKNCRSELEKYGVQIADDEGNFYNLSDIIYNVASAFEGLSDTEGAALAKTVAGQSQYTGLQTILKGVNEQAEASGMSLSNYADALAECDGAAKDMAQTMQDNLKGKLTILDSAMQALQQSSFELFDDTMKEGVDAATEAIGRLNDSVKSGSLNTSLARLSKSLGNLAEKSIDAAEKGLPGLIDGLSFILDNASTITTGILGVVSALKAMEVVNTLTASYAAFSAATENATVAQWAFNTALGANPIVAAAAAVAGLTIALGAYAVAGTIAADGSTEQTEAIDDLAYKYEQLSNNIREGQRDRQSAKDDLEQNAEIANELANNLENLNASYQSLVPGSAAAASNMAQQKEIISQLNAVYPNLNLSINEQTGALNMGNKELRDRIDLLKNEAKAEAYQEYLVEIAEQQIEAKKTLKSATDDLKEAEQTEKDALEKYNAELEKSKNLTGENASELDAAQATYQKAIESTEELKNKQKDAKDALYELNVEYDATAQEVEAANGTLQSATGTVEGLGDAAQGAADSVQQLKLSEEELTAFTEKVEGAVDSAVSVFEEYKAASETSKETLQKNLKDQVEGLQQWADDFKELSSKGIDDGLLKTLAEMGPEAETYIKGLLSMTDEELSSYSDSYAEAMKIKESAKAEIVQSYLDAGTESFEAYQKGLSDASSASSGENSAEYEVGKTSAQNILDGVSAKADEAASSTGEELVNKIAEGANNADLQGQMQTIGEESTKSLAASIADTSETPKTEAETMAKETLKAITDTLNADAMAPIGEEINKALAESIRSGASEVVNAMIEVCTKAIDEAKSQLQTTTSAAASKVSKTTGSASASSKATSASSQAVDSVAADSASVLEQSVSKTNSSIDSLVTLVNEYLPQLAEKDTSANVNVVLEGDADGVFNLVRTQNSIFKTSTGRSAF